MICVVDRADPSSFCYGFAHHVLQQHINEGVVDDGLPALSSFLRVKKMTVSPPSFKMYRVEIALHNLSITTQSHLTQQHSVPLTSHGDVPTMVVSIPGPILECAFPTLVQQLAGRVLPTTAQPEPVRFLLTVEIWSDTLQILPLLVPSIPVPRIDVGISAHSPGSEDFVPEQDILNRMVVDPDMAHTSNPDFIDLTLSDY